LTRPAILPAILIVAAFGVLVALGTGRSSARPWKEELIATRKAASRRRLRICRRASAGNGSIPRRTSSPASNFRRASLPGQEAFVYATGSVCGPT